MKQWHYPWYESEYESEEEPYSTVENTQELANWQWEEVEEEEEN
jgi:hypothetical protein